MAKLKVELQVDGMTCEGCVRTIESRLAELPGVDYAHVNLGAGKVAVEFDDVHAKVPDLIDAVEPLGFHASHT